MATSNKFGTVEKIYSLKIVGIDPVINGLSSVRLALQKVADAKIGLDRKMSLAQTPVEVKSLQEEFEQLRIKEEQLTRSLILLQNQLQALTELQALEAERTRNGGQATESAIGAYMRLNAQYKESKANLESVEAEYGKNSAEALRAAETAGIYKKQLADIAALAKQGPSAPAVSGSPAVNAELIKQRENQRLLNLETKNTVIANNAEEGSIVKMRAQLALLTREYDKMSKAKRESSEGVQKLQDIKTLSTDLNALEQSTGRFNRNVGNYSSTLTGYINTIRGLRGPTKLIGEWLGLGAQEADNFRLLIEHSMQGFVAWLRGKEAKAGTEATDTAATAANTAAQETNTEVTGANTVAEEVNSTATAANTATTTANVAAVEANAVATEAGAVAQTEMAVATTATSTAMKVFRIAMLATGIGVVIGLIALAVVALKNWRDEMKQTLHNLELLSDLTEKAADSYGKERAELDVLVKKLQDEHVPRQQKLDLLKELKSKQAGYFDDLKTEKDLVDKLPAAYEKAVQGILLKAKAEAAQGLIGENYAKQLKAQAEFAKKEGELSIEEYNALSNEAQYSSKDSKQYQQLKEFYKNARKVRSDEYGKDVEQVQKDNQFLIKTILSGNDDILKLGGKVDDKKPTPTKAYTGAKLSGEEKDALKIIEATRETMLSLENKSANDIEKVRNLTFDEEISHLKRLEKINVDALNEKAALLNKKGKLNAEEKEQAAKFGEEISKTELEASQRISEIEKRRFAEQEQNLKNLRDKSVQTAQDTRDAVNENINSTPSEKAGAQQGFDQTNLDAAR